jgi:hypothetical protein
MFMYVVLFHFSFPIPATWWTAGDLEDTLILVLGGIYMEISASPGMLEELGAATCARAGIFEICRVFATPVSNCRCRKKHR